MRLASRKIATGFQGRAEKLRRGRIAAPTLRDLAPDAAHLTVSLQFTGDEVRPHATQSFVLYPGARAYFEFPCPCGDCDGIYDLRPAAESALRNPGLQATGALECSGTRASHRVPSQPCGVQMSYTVTAGLS